MKHGGDTVAGDELLQERCVPGIVDKFPRRSLDLAEVRKHHLLREFAGCGALNIDRRLGTQQDSE